MCCVTPLVDAQDVCSCWTVSLMAPCSAPGHRFSLYEPADFIASHLKDKLEWTPVRESVALHVPCSSKKLGTTSAFEQIAGLCAKEVTPSGVPCCGAPVAFARSGSCSPVLDCPCLPCTDYCPVPPIRLLACTEALLYHACLWDGSMVLLSLC